MERREVFNEMRDRGWWRVEVSFYWSEDRNEVAGIVAITEDDEKITVENPTAQSWGGRLTVLVSPQHRTPTGELVPAECRPATDDEAAAYHAFYWALQEPVEEGFGHILRDARLIWSLDSGGKVWVEGEERVVSYRPTRIDLA